MVAHQLPHRIQDIYSIPVCEKQFQPVILRVSDIVSDRDTKLTRATYTTLEDLIANLDTHNTMVNAILFNAWGVPEKTGIDHLTEIKAEAGFIAF